MIEIKNIGKKFNDLPVLSNISFNITKGEVFSIIGSSGAGKTTLLRCLNNLEVPTSGEILIDGDDTITLFNSRKLNQKVGMVFQSFNLFDNFTVIENLIIAPNKLLGINREKAMRDAKELLEKFNLMDKADILPMNLSGGQKQRIAIARALMMKPEIMLFDEPTSALDPKTTLEIHAIIKDLSKNNITIVLVTHEMKFAKNISDRLAYMEAGRIIEIAAPKVMFGNPSNAKTREFLSHEGIIVH